MQFSVGQKGILMIHGGFAIQRETAAAEPVLLGTQHLPLLLGLAFQRELGSVGWGKWVKVVRGTNFQVLEK